MRSRRIQQIPALVSTLFMLWLVPSAAAYTGQDTPALKSADSSYCAYTESLGDDERQPLMSPHLAASVGKVNFLSGNDSTAATSTLRERIGVSYSLQETMRGLAIQARSHADCERYRASSTLLNFLQLGEQGLELDAVSARLAVLEGAVPAGQAILSRTKASVDAYRSTSAQMDAISIRLDRLRTSLNQARKEVASPTGAAPLKPFGSLRQAISQQQAQDAIYERSLSKIRQTSAWNLTVESGYEHLSNVHRYSPYYWAINLDTSLGLFSRHRAESNAVLAHGEFTMQDPTGATQRAGLLLKKLQSDLTLEQDRLRENTVLLREMEGRLDSLKLVTDVKASEYSDDVWFEMIELKAEHEYLRVHIDTLGQILGQEAPAEMVQK
jgi:hypothetical protein